MTKVKTFTTEIQIFRTMNELKQLDAEVNKFIADNPNRKVISVSDVCTTNGAGMTIGIIRVLAYEEMR